MNITISSGAELIDKETARIIEAAVTETVKYAGFANAAVDITVLDNEAIRAVNKEYRGKDTATDCLSFPQYEKNELPLPGKKNKLLLGDVVISYEKAFSQAEEYGHHPLREFAFLAVHSTLHLLGYDHITAQDEKDMQNAANIILEQRLMLRR